MPWDAPVMTATFCVLMVSFFLVWMRARATRAAVVRRRLVWVWVRAWLRSGREDPLRCGGHAWIVSPTGYPPRPVCSCW